MIIHETELFKGIDFDVMEKLASICIEENYAKDTVLFQKGEKAENLYILEEGTVNLEIKNGGSLVYSLTDPGEVFGWSSLVEPALYTASGVCATDLKAVRIEKKKLNMILNDHPGTGLMILRRLGGVFSKRLAIVYQDLLTSKRIETVPSYG